MIGSRIKMYYLEGREAYESGDIDVSLNPYRENSPTFNNWEAGWTDAWYDKYAKERS